MNYEQFLFTRNQRRDFTAFVRPADMTLKEVSLLASAFNFITDVAVLTSEQPGLYCFPLGVYTFVLRHYDSGRKHAGREIGVIEGIAVRVDETNALVNLLPEIIERQTDILDVVSAVEDIEEIEVSRSETLSLTPNPSPDWRREKDLLGETQLEFFDPVQTEEISINPIALPDSQAEETSEAFDDDLLVDAERLTDEQLVLTFDDDGRSQLIETLTRMPTKPLHFAFGTNSDVINRLAEAEIDFDVLGLFGATEAAFRPRVVKQRVAKVAAPVTLPPLIEPEPVAPMPTKREHHSLLGKLVGWLLGR